MIEMQDGAPTPRKRLPPLAPTAPPASGVRVHRAGSSDPDTAEECDGEKQSPQAHGAADAKDKAQTHLNLQMHDSDDDQDETDDDGLSTSIDEDRDTLDIPKHRQSQWQQLMRWLRRIHKTFGLSFLLLVGTVYAVQGFSSFSGLAVKYFFKDELLLQPAESQALMTIMQFPWGIKPIYGIVSDSLPLFKYHRKSYMMCFSALSVLAFWILSIPNGITTPMSAVVAIMMTNLSSAFIDVVIDARVVEMSRLDSKNGANDLQSVSWMSMSIGGVIGSVLSGPATDNLGVRTVFFFAAFGPLLVLLLSFYMPETASRVKAHDFATSARQQFFQLKRAVQTPVIWKCALWVFLSGAVSPGFSQIFFFFSTEVLMFTPEFLGSLSACGYVFLLLGTMLYNSCFKDISFRRIFFIAQASLAVISLLDIVLVTRANLALGIPDKAFLLGDAAISDVVSRLKTMPVLVLSAKLCPKGIEGTLFALLMSISNFSYSISEFWGALVCVLLGIERDQYDNLWLAIAFRSVLKILPIALLFLIPASDPQEIVDSIQIGDSTDTIPIGSQPEDSTELQDDSENDDDDADVGVIRLDHCAASSSPRNTAKVMV